MSPLPRAVAAGAFAERHGWRVVEFFEDAGISGAKGRDKRPGLDRPLKAVARRDVDMVAAWSVDRLGRSLIDLLDFLRELHAPSELAFGLHGNSKHYPPFGGSTGEGRPS